MVRKRGTHEKRTWKKRRMYACVCVCLRNVLDKNNTEKNQHTNAKTHMWVSGYMRTHSRSKLNERTDGNNGRKIKLTKQRKKIRNSQKEYVTICRAASNIHRWMFFFAGLAVRIASLCCFSGGICYRYRHIFNQWFCCTDFSPKIHTFCC